MALGLCRQIELDDAVRLAAEKKEKSKEEQTEGGATIKPTTESLRSPAEPQMSEAITSLKDLKLGSQD